MPDHDAIFKLLLTTFFAEFLALFFPDLLTLIDRDRLTFLDKELIRNPDDPDRRDVDLVVQVPLRDSEAFIVVHLEHQAQPDATLDRRMFRYFALLYERYSLPIYPIALCSYAAPRTPVRDRHKVSIGAFTPLEFRYRVVQLNQLDWRDYVHTPNPVAAALMTRMRIAKQDRVRVKLMCLHLLFGLPLATDDRNLIGTFISTYLRLEPAEEARVQHELAALRPDERTNVMQLMTEWEIKGRQEGRQEMAAELTLRQLTRKLGDLDATTRDRIAALPTERLTALSEALLDFASPADLHAWLDTP